MTDAVGLVSHRSLLVRRGRLPGRRWTGPPLLSGLRRQPGGGGAGGAGGAAGMAGECLRARRPDPRAPLPYGHLHSAGTGLKKVEKGGAPFAARRWSMASAVESMNLHLKAAVDVLL